MVLKLSIFVLAVLLVLLGIRGTYANFWNNIFPHYPVQAPTGGATTGPGPAQVQVTQGGSTVQAPVGNTGTTQPVVIGGSVNPIHNIGYAPGGSVNPVQAVVSPPGTPHWICDANGQNCHEVFG